MERRELELDRREINLQRRENELRAKELDRRQEILAVNETRGTNRIPLLTSTHRERSQYSSPSNLKPFIDINTPIQEIDKCGRVADEEKSDPKFAQMKPIRAYAPELKLKEVTETIPRFDGYNIYLCSNFRGPVNE